MKKVRLATKYKFNIKNKATIGKTYRLSIGTTEKILRSSMKEAGIANSDKIIGGERVQKT